MKTPLTFNSVWDALAGSPAEAMNLRLRSELMRRITAVIDTQGWSQAETARRANVLPPRISDLQRGQLHRFSLDALVNIAAALGCDVRLKLKHVA